jgi:hypothetical protein
LVFAKPAPKPRAEVKPVAEPEPVAEVTPAASVGGNDDELIAVITAAIAAYIASEEPEAYQGGFRVVSFKRSTQGAWNRK